MPRIVSGLLVKAYRPDGSRPAIMQVIIQGQRSDGSYSDLLFNEDFRGSEAAIALPDRASGRRALVVVRDSGSRSGKTLITRYMTLPLAGQTVTLSNRPRWRPKAALTARVPVRSLPRAPTMLRGFGQVEQVVGSPATNSGLKTAVAIGGIGLLGIGLWYGLTTKRPSGGRAFRGAV